MALTSPIRWRASETPCSWSPISSLEREVCTRVFIPARGQVTSSREDHGPGSPGTTDQLRPLLWAGTTKGLPVGQWAANAKAQWVQVNPPFALKRNEVQQAAPSLDDLAKQNCFPKPAMRLFKAEGLSRGLSLVSLQGLWGTVSCACFPGRVCRESAFSVKQNQNNLAQLPFGGS